MYVAKYDIKKVNYRQLIMSLDIEEKVAIKYDGNKVQIQFTAVHWLVKWIPGAIRHLL
jgi:hypothetical protein